MDVIVIGGGPAGMMAAISAAEEGLRVLLLEKMPSLGRKLRITGKGRCNITTAKNRDEFLKRVHRNGRFLYSALDQMSSQEVCSFFESRGCPLKIERGDRVFPKSDSAIEVLHVLQETMYRLGVKVMCNESVTDIEPLVAGQWQIKTRHNTYFACNVILATGGLSYPGTGSTGDGYRFANYLGINTVSPQPALVPVVCRQSWMQAAQGLSLRNVVLKVYNHNGKLLVDDFGEMMCTHYGLSGPLVLTASGQMVDVWQRQPEPLIGTVDLKPALNDQQLDTRLLREMKENGKKHIRNVLKNILPQKLIEPFCDLCMFDTDKPMHDLRKQERLKMVSLMKALPIEFIHARDIREAIVTAGGISVKEIEPKTMAVKKYEGLYIAGELIDVDAETGGYNLQIAFSTGYAAGKGIAKRMKKKGDSCENSH